MKNGINLSSSRSFFEEVPPRLWWIDLFAILLVSGLHVAMMWRLQSAKEDLTHRMHAGQGSLERLDRQLETVRADLDTPAASETIEQLVALDRSGVLMTIAPAEVLSEIAKVPPGEARVISARLRAAASQRELELDAVTTDPEAAVTFLGGLTESPLVRRAEVLEETPCRGESSSIGSWPSSVRPREQNEGRLAADTARRERSGLRAHHQSCKARVPTAD